MLKSWTTLALFYASTSYAADAVYNLDIANNNVSPDGISKQAITVNGGIDGPLLKANKGDQFKVTVNDQNTVGPPVMLKSTSIHWHGLFQHRTAAQDGPAFVTQCPIATGNSFTYDFSTGDQAGTFWYHSHLGTQYCDGLRGPLVIYDPNDAQKDLYDVDNDNTVITISDWYDKTSLQAFPVSLPRPGPPTPAAHLINGKGRRTSTNSDLSVVSVTQNTRYRFRLVHMGCLPSYQFFIEGHRMTVIEADGIAHQPHDVDSLTMFIGQRYSVVVNANQDIANYWIRIIPSAGPTGFTNSINSAILRYDGAPIANPTTNPTAPVGSALLERDLVPLVNPGAPTTDDANFQRFNLVVGRDTASGNFTIRTNGGPATAFVPPTAPVLLQILSGTPAQNLLPVGSVIEVDKDKVVEVSIPGGGNHPFHLHGHAFDLIRSTGQTTTNLVNPPRRDVVSIGGGGDNITFRFATDNPGPWILHCHIDWHLDAGLAIVFAERVDENVSGDQAQIHNSDWDNLCQAYDNLAPGDL